MHENGGLFGDTLDVVKHELGLLLCSETSHTARCDHEATLIVQHYVKKIRAVIQLRKYAFERRARCGGRE